METLSFPDFLAQLPGGPTGETAVAVQKAYEFACQAHGDHLCPANVSYPIHDLAVAQSVTELGLDVNAIQASLLQHIWLPHTGRSEADLHGRFPQDVIDLVASLHNLESMAAHQDYRPFSTSEDAHSLEQIRRAILTITEGDIRTMLIRMADCLQDLRYAEHRPRTQQLELANEGLYIFAPLANRLGIWQFKWELEDLGFRYLEPEKYQEITEKLVERRAERARKIQAAADQLRDRLVELGFQASVTGRPKHIYSIYRKMKRKGVDIDHIYDIQALRVILQPVDVTAYAGKSAKEKDDEDRSLCYQVLGAVHSLWQPLMKEFDDYIATPKPNGYKSLHTAVIDPQTGDTLEVQIRTNRMHEEAEKGVAAHWAYKESGVRVSASVQRRIQSLRDLLTAIQEADDDAFSTELLQAEIGAETIHVFTPKGHVKELPVGATPIDFAYQIHTEVGHRCRGARVNGKLVNLDYKLQSGDKVEIITANRGGPNRDWMNPIMGYTGSTRTRSKIRQWFREQEREKNIQQGREVVLREIKRLGLSEIYTIEDIALALKYDDLEKFLSKVGFGDIQTAQINGAIALMRRSLQPDDELRPLLQPPPLEKKAKGLTVRGLSGLHTRMAKCCNPIPPEPIIGYITRGQGVTIHRQDCKQALAITEHERLIEVGWGLESETYPIPIVIKAYRRAGLIDEMNNVLRGKNINIPKTKRTTEGNLTTIYLVAEVTDLNQLNWLMKKFENLPNVIEVSRQRWT